jgi:hypothetical protein
MKKLISIKDLQFGMFLDAEEAKYLSATNATGVGSAGKRARLAGRMNEKIMQDGGLLIGSDNIVVSLRSMGLSMVTIDTDKGEDMPDNVKPLTDPSRSRRPKIAWSTPTKRSSRPWKSAPRPPTPSRRLCRTWPRARRWMSRRCRWPEE